MTAILFADDWPGAVALGLACYAGVVLYAALLSVDLETSAGPRRAVGADAFVSRPAPGHEPHT